MKRLIFLFTTAFICFSSLVNGQDYAIYVSDAGNFSASPWQILKYDQNGENGEVFISENLGWPQDILFLEDENQVLISNLNTDEINIHDAETGAYIGLFADEADGPTRMQIGPDGDIYVLQWLGNGKVLKYDRDGTYLGEFTEIGVSRSIGMAWDTDGNLYVSSYNQSNVRHFDPDGLDLGLFINSDVNGPTNIWFDEAGDFYLNNYNVGNVLHFDSEGSLIDTLIASIGQPEGVAVLENGDLLIGNGIAGSVIRYGSDGTFIEELISSQPLDLLTPNAVVLRPTEALSTEQFDAYTDVVIVPVPGDSFRLQTKTKLNIEEVLVFNQAGERVARERNVSKQLWDARSFPAGVYMLHIRMKDGGEIIRKVVVAHKNK